MRLMVMAAERAATIATTIQRIWRSVGQEFRVARAASNAPVSAKGKAKTECSNLIISSTVRMREALTLWLLSLRMDRSSGTFSLVADGLAPERGKHIASRGRRLF